VESSDVNSFESLEADILSQWKLMRMASHTAQRAQEEVRFLNIHRVRYVEVETMAKVPWYWVGIMHMREASGNFHAWLHNGDPMFDQHGRSVQTVHVPRHRPLNPEISWAGGALDCLEELGFANQDWVWNPQRCLWGWEKANGFGYREWHHIPTPYNWGGTSVQEPGKYVRDAHFDPSVMDEQLGCAAVLKLILDEENKA